MRKQELVQLHVLCSHVRRYAECRYDLPEEAFDRYDRMDVPPVAVYRKKEAHKEALDLLLEDLTSALATHSEESPMASLAAETRTGEVIPERRG